MEPHKIDIGKLERLGFTWEGDTDTAGTPMLVVYHGEKWACFTGDNYQSELSAYLLGWEASQSGAEQIIAKLRSALADLLGVGPEESLDGFETAIRTMPAPGVDKTVAINAIDALRLAIKRETGG